MKVLHSIAMWEFKEVGLWS